tara:strand:- start:5109 stop:6425 length:1317 start_codon:yes stop_codon:yes gene_type:complete
VTIERVDSMIVDIRGHSDLLRFIFKVEEEDKVKPSEKFRMGERECYFSLPMGVSVDRIHPDHLALVSLMLCFPFIGESIRFPRGISKEFHDAAGVISRFSVGPIDEDISPYRSPESSKPALALSGGVDSVTALAIMPEETVSFFLDRPINLFARSLYDKEAAHMSCKELGKLGHNVVMVETDLEYLRKPVGFPVDVANSSPAILLAEEFALDSIAFGTIMESAYGIGSKSYRHYPNGSHNRLWGTLFQAAGLPLNLVVAGMSEVATSKIMIEHEIGPLSQSCIRGKWKSPCLNCWKCFRKSLLDSTLRKEEIDDGILDKLFNIAEAKHHLRSFPIKHENVLSYICERYYGSHKLMSLLKRRVGADKSDLKWLESWNPESIELIFPKYRDEIVSKIVRLIPTMDEFQINKMKSWDMEEMLQNQEFKSLSEELDAALSSL